MLRKLGQAPTVSAFSSSASLLFTFLLFCFQALQEQNLYQQRHILMRWWHYGMWWQTLSCNLTCLEVLRRIALNTFLNLPWLEEDHRYQILAPYSKKLLVFKYHMELHFCEPAICTLLQWILQVTRSCSYSDVNLRLIRNKLLIIIIIELLLIIYCFSAGIDLLMYSWVQQNIRRKLTCGKKA